MGRGAAPRRAPRGHRPPRHRDRPPHLRIVTAVQRLDGSGEAVRARLTVAFTDGEGRDHHVTRTVTTADRLLPAVGGKLPLWYDPADPGDLPSIVVGRSW